MKRVILISMIAIGLAQSSRAADLVWAPNDANWDTVTQNWTNTSTLVSVAFAQQDNVLFDDTGFAYLSVALGTNLLSPSAVVVNSWQDYLLTSSTGGKLTNVASLTKQSYGKLTLDADCVITNSITIEAGTLQIGNGAGRGTLGSGYPGYTAPVNNNGTLAFNRTGTLNFSNNISGSGTLSIPATATGTWNLYGNNTMTDYSIVHNGNMPLVFRPPASLGSPASVQVYADYGVNVRIQMGGQIHFPATCPMAATLAYGTNNVRFSLMGIAGSNSVSGAISLAGATFPSDPNATRPQVNLYAQNAGSELTVYSSVTESDPVGNPYLGDFFLRGSGLAGRMYGTINLPNAQFQKVEAVPWTLYSTGNKATITYISNGRLNMGVANALPVAQLTVVSPGVLDLAGFNQVVGPLWSSGTITNSSTTSDALLTLTNGGAYTGAIKDSGTTKIALKLLNPGSPLTQQLLGDCSYRGATTLDIATAIALGNSGLPNSTPIEMGNGSSIDLTNKADHTFTLGAAQTLKADGTVHVAGAFVSQGTIELKAGKSGPAISSDKVAVSSQMTCGGTLKLDLSGDSLDANDSFTLFSAASYSGAFSSINPATPSAGFAWNTNTLTADGTLRIFSTSQPNVTTEVVSGGTQLHLTWPTDHTGWILQGQTNTVGGITTNWYDVPGSPLSNEIYMPIEPANGSVFYRLVYRP